MDIDNRVLLVLLESEGSKAGAILARPDASNITDEQLRYHYQHIKGENWVEGKEYAGGGFKIRRLTAIGHRIRAELRRIVD